MSNDSLITLNEAATLLGVSPATLRNWDKKGKLPAVRNPANNYRLFRLSQVLEMQKATMLFQPSESETPEHDHRHIAKTSHTDVKRTVNALHKILRDSVGTSSILERFDEIIKLLYCKASLDRRGDTALISTESPVTVLQSEYADLVQRQPSWFPKPFDRLRLPPAVLTRMSEALLSLDLSPSTQLDAKGIAFEEMIRNTFDKGDNQQFFTPPGIVSFMAEVLADHMSGVLCDPACGTGGFLLEFMRHTQQLPKPKKLRTKIIGCEIDPRLAWASRMNLLLHDCEQFEIACLAGAGSLARDPHPPKESVDCILTNPPFGSDLAAGDDLDSFVLGRDRQSRRRGVLFIERCLDLLKPGGVLGIVIDDGVLNGPTNEDTRSHLLHSADLLAVTSLPESAFMPYASVRASVLFLKKHRKGKKSGKATSTTLFSHAKEVGRRPNGEPLLRTDPITKKITLASDLPHILKSWREGVGSSHSDSCFWAPSPSILDDELRDSKWRLDSQYHHPSRQVARQSLESSPYPLMRLSELCEVRSESMVPSVEFGDEEMTYVGLANIQAITGVVEPSIVLGRTLKSSVKRFEPGDLLFSRMRPELRKACLVPDAVGDGYASSECTVLTPRQEIDGYLVLPDLLSELLRSDLVYGQIVHQVIGIGRPRLSKGALLAIELPVPPRHRQFELLQSFSDAQSAAEELIQQSEEAKRRADGLIRKARETLATGILQGAEEKMRD